MSRTSADGTRSTCSRIRGEPDSQASIDGGQSPVWRRDGKELFFAQEAGRESMMAVSVEILAMPDGRCVMTRYPDRSTLREFVLVRNWFSELERLAPTRH